MVIYFPWLYRHPRVAILIGQFPTLDVYIGYKVSPRFLGKMTSFDYDLSMSFITPG
jgi:hypothetical protein